MGIIFLGKLLHGAACIFLIVIVLLQADKGEGLSGAFGAGGGGAIFGKRGASGFFAKATAGAAIVFMLTSFWLGYKSGFHAAGVRPNRAAPTAPAVPDTDNFPGQ
jgi:preprotein translocase subunit SecG